MTEKERSSRLLNSSSHQPVPHSKPNNSFNLSPTSFASALPPLFFIACPTSPPSSPGFLLLWIISSIPGFACARTVSQSCSTASDERERSECRWRMELTRDSGEIWSLMRWERRSLAETAEERGGKKNDASKEVRKRNGQRLFRVLEVRIPKQQRDKSEEIRLTTDLPFCKQIQHLSQLDRRNLLPPSSLPRQPFPRQRSHQLLTDPIPSKSRIPSLRDLFEELECR